MEFLKNLFSFLRYQLLKSKNSAGQIFGFHRFPKNAVGRFLSVKSLMIFSLGTKLTFIGSTDFHSSDSGSQKIYFEKFYRIFLKCVVVCPLQLQGINNMWI